MRPLLLTCLLLLPCYAHAVERAPQPPSTYTAEDVFRFMEEEMEILTLTLVRTKLREVAQPAIIITGEEIRRLNAVNIADLLRHIPGTVVTNPTGAQWAVSVYTTVYPVSVNFLLVQVDGRSAYSAFSNVVNWWPIPVALEDIERMEIVLGPSSTLHGAQAVMGVINIITKRPTTSGGTFKVVGGSSLGQDERMRHGDAQVHASGTALLGGWGLRLAGGYERLTQWDSTRMVVDGRHLKPIAGQRCFTNGKALTEISADADLELNIGGSVHEAPFFVFGMGQIRGNEAYLDGRLALRNNLTATDRLQLRAEVRHTTMYIDNAFDFLLPSTELDYRDLAFLGRASYVVDLPASNRLISGVELRSEHHDSAIIRPEGRVYRYVSLWGQDEYRPWEWLIFTIGLRLEKQHNALTSLSQRLALVPRVGIVGLLGDDHTLRLNYGEGIYNPSAQEDFGDIWLHQGKLGGYVTDVYLEPRRIRAIEAGYRGRLAPTFLVTGNYAFRHANLLYELDSVGEAILPIRVQAIRHSGSFHSLDLTASWRPFGLFRADAAYTRIFGLRQPPQSKQYGSTPPPHRLSWRLHLMPFDGAHVDMEGQWISPRVSMLAATQQTVRVAGWLRLSAKASYRVWRDPEIEVFVMGVNLLNKRTGRGLDPEYSDPNTSPVGQRFWVGLRLSPSPE